MEGPTQAPTQPPLKHGDNTIYVKKSILLILGVIALITLVLTMYTGQRIWSQRTSTPTPTPTTSPTPAVSVPKIKKVGPEAPKNELLKQVPTTTTKEQQSNRELLMTNKRDTAIVFINAQCATSPTVANLVDVSKLKISNEDTLKHTLIIDTQHTYTVEPKTILAVDLATFTKDTFYPYTCDEGKDISGYIYIPK